MNDYYKNMEVEKCKWSLESQAIDLATTALNEGRAKEKLDTLIKYTNEVNN